MTTRNLWTTMTVIFLLSIVGMGLWLFEILQIKSWYGLNWLSGSLYSPHIATFIAVFAFMTPLIISRQVAIKKIVTPTFILYAASILCFEVGKQLCYKLYCRFCFWTTIDIVIILSIAFTLFIFLGLSYWLTTQTLIKRNKKVNILYTTTLLLLTIPLSLVTVQVNPGFGSGTGWVDAVKMGYPIFWITIMLGLSGIIIAVQNPLIAK